MTHLGEMLRLYRSINKWTMRELAREIGIMPSTLCRIEHGQAMDAATYLKLQVWMMRGENRG